MQPKSPMTGEPGFDRGRLVGAVVVQYQVHLELGRDIGFDGTQESEELLGTVTPMQLWTSPEKMDTNI